MRQLVLLTTCLAIASQLGAETTESVLSLMDQRAAKFTGLSANLTRSTYTKVIDDTTVESGTILLKKHGPKDLQVRIELTKPDTKTVGFRGRRAEVYLPKLKTVQEYDLGKHGGLVDQFLLIGFGTAGKDLKANYAVKYIGEEMVAGQKTHKLELLPSAAELKERLRKLELWVGATGEYPVQQKFTQQSGDYYLFTYTAVKLNPELTDESVRLNLPKGVKREKMQK